MSTILVTVVKCLKHFSGYSFEYCIKHQTNTWEYADTKNVPEIEITFTEFAQIFQLQRGKGRGRKRLECFNVPSPVTKIQKVRARLNGNDGWGVRSLELQKFVGSNDYLSFSPNAPNKEFGMDGNDNGVCKDGAWCTLTETTGGKLCFAFHFCNQWK